MNLLGSPGRGTVEQRTLHRLRTISEGAGVAERLGWVAGMAQMEVDIGYVYKLSAQQLPGGDRSPEQSIKHAAKAGDDGIASEAYFELGYLYLNLKDSTRCVMAFKESLAAASRWPPRTRTRDPHESAMRT